MPDADLIIQARWVIPVDAENTQLNNHAIAIVDGRISAIFPAADIHRWNAAQIIDYSSHALIPGLINTHTHAAMSLFRGIADDLPLMQWLENHIWPAEQAFVNEQFIQDGSQLAIAEMLRSGTTCFSDMYLFPEITARIAATIGIRCSIGLIVIDFPTAYADTPEAYISKGLELYDEYKHHPLVNFTFAPHAPYTVADAPLQRVRILADELDIPLHMHVHETQDEINQGLDKYNMRPLQRLHQLGLIEPGLLAVHMTQLNEDEIDLLVEKAIQVIHCPESNMKLASGVCPVQKLLDRGINVALGTDGAASNNDLDMLGEMKTAALLGKLQQQDASALPATQILRMATINGAQALGISDQTGSLEVGKWADFCAIDLSGIENQPIYDPVSQIIYSAGREQVTDVWVAGQQLLKNRQLTTVDEQDLLKRVESWQQRIRQHSLAGQHGN
ncbi:MAG: TRZ/ATZ family hydrolase [Gammaproteobacteria bacterium]